MSNYGGMSIPGGVSSAGGTSNSGATSIPGGIEPGVHNSAGHLLSLIRSGRARTRGDLQQLTGLSRSTVGQRLDRLIDGGYLRQPGVNESTGGRPPTLLEFNDQHGVVLAGDLGATHAQLAVLDLAGRPLAEERADRRIADGPQAVLDWVGERFTALLAEAGAWVRPCAGSASGFPVR